MVVGGQAGAEGLKGIGATWELHGPMGRAGYGAITCMQGWEGNGECSCGILGGTSAEPSFKVCGQGWRGPGWSDPLHVCTLCWGTHEGTAGPDGKPSVNVLHCRGMMTCTRGLHLPPLWPDASAAYSAGTRQCPIAPLASFNVSSSASLRKHVARLTSGTVPKGQQRLTRLKVSTAPHLSSADAKPSGMHTSSRLI